MQFTADAIPRIADGSITLTFRNWTRPQAKPGGRQRMWGIMIEVSDVSVVTVDSITDDDARRAGSESALAVRARFGQPTPDTVYRVEFQYVGPDDRIARRSVATLDDDQRAAIQARLDRMDRSSAAGPWTRSTLRLIGTYPGVVSTALAKRAGSERPAFKLNVRKLKELGLTESLDVGYRLSPLGEQFVSSTNR